jgi:hypothetical protein
LVREPRLTVGVSMAHRRAKARNERSYEANSPAMTSVYVLKQAKADHCGEHTGTAI